jgi:hypothetical protein
VGIQKFANNSAGMAAASAVAEPRHIWIDCDVIKVFTGADMPLFDPRPTVTKWQLVQACADAGITEAQIDASVALLTPKRQRFWRHTNIIDRDNPFSSNLRTNMTPVPTPPQWTAIFLAAAALDPLIV